MKIIIMLFVLLIMQDAYTQNYIREAKLGTSYVNLTLGTTSISPSMGTSSLLGFGSQVNRWDQFAIGFDFLAGTFKRTTALDGGSRFILPYLKYYFFEKLSFAVNMGFASQNLYSSTTGQPAANYGAAGITIGYDFKPSRENSWGYAFDIYSLSVANNPAQSWAGINFVLKYWD